VFDEEYEKWILKTLMSDAIQLDESTDMAGKAQIPAFSRLVCKGDIIEKKYIAHHYQKQQKAKTILISTVISVLTISHGNHAPTSAQTASLCVGTPEKEPWNFFNIPFRAYRGPNFKISST
jgi:hypothetical protein